MSNSDIFFKTNQLFQGSIYKKVTKHSSFTQIKSFFNEEWYNFIIPSISVKKFDWNLAEGILNFEKISGNTYSYYIPEKFHEGYKIFS